MFGMNGFHVSASGAIQGHHGPLVITFDFVDCKLIQFGPVQNNIMWYRVKDIVEKGENPGYQHFLHFPECFIPMKDNFNIYSYI